jgi:NAD(P)H-hydrate repair Nnr-like enzyme with NAD(P)H-hydrate dehydratase domain
VTVVIKGHKDLILHKGNKISIVGGRGSLKRCGGMGDVLSGCISACINWSQESGVVLGCHVTKLAAELAYAKHGRSLTGLGVLDFVEEALQRIEK